MKPQQPNIFHAGRTICAHILLTRFEVFKRFLRLSFIFEVFILRFSTFEVFILRFSIFWGFRFEVFDVTIKTKLYPRLCRLISRCSFKTSQENGHIHGDEWWAKPIIISQSTQLLTLHGKVANDILRFSLFLRFSFWVFRLFEVFILRFSIFEVFNPFLRF